MTRNSTTSVSAALPNRKQKFKGRASEKVRQIKKFNRVNSKHKSGKFKTGADRKSKEHIIVLLLTRVLDSVAHSAPNAP